MTRKRRHKKRRHAAKRAPGRLVVAFELDAQGRIGHYARLIHALSGEIVEVPVPLLPRIADVCEPAGFETMMQAVAAYHAEQSGNVGRA